MPGTREVNSDLDVKGLIKVSTVPNNTGTILTHNASTNTISTRTNTQILSDLGLTTVVSNSHTHTNKAVLDGITSALITNWNNSFGWGNHSGLYVSRGSIQNGTLSSESLNIDSTPLGNYDAYVSSASTNKPLTTGGFLSQRFFTSVGTDYVQQTFDSVNSNRFFKRFNLTANWVELYHTGNLDTSTFVNTSTNNQVVNGNKKFQSLQVLAETVTNITQGWNRIATLTGRGYVEVVFQTTGGSQTPVNHTIKICAGWSNTTWNIDVDRNGTSSYIRQARIVREDNITYLEVDFTSAIATSRLGKSYLKGYHDLELTFITPTSVTALVGDLYCQSFSNTQGQTIESTRFRATNFIKDGGTNNEVLLAGGSSKPISDFVSDSTQTLISSAVTPGYVGISDGNNIVLQDLFSNSKQDGNSRILNNGFKPYRTVSGQGLTNYPSTVMGTGFRIERFSSATAQMGFDIYNADGQDYLWYKTFRGETTENTWKIIADRTWVESQNYLTLSGLPNPSLITSTTSTGTSNVATTNTNTYLNIVYNGGSIGSSSQITGAGSVSVSSDAAGKITITGTNTTYGVETLANLNAGTSTTGLLQSAKNLNDWLNGKNFEEKSKRHRRYFLNTVSYATTGVLRVNLCTAFGGIVKIKVCGSYSSQNANGAIVLMGGLGANTTTLWNNQIRCISSIGESKNVFYVDPIIKVDATTNEKYFEIHKKTASNNPIYVVIEYYSNGEINDANTTPSLGEWITTGVSTLTNFPYFDTQIDTASHGNSSQWKSAYDDSHTHSNKAILDATTASFTTALKTKLDGLSNYVLPTASASVLGGIKVGSNLSIDANGVLSSTNTNTTYTAGNGLTLSGTQFSLPVTVSGTGTYVQSVVQTANGITVTLGTPPNTNTTYSNMSIAEMNAGTVTTGRIIQSSVLNQWFDGKSVFGLSTGGGIKTNIWTSNALSPYAIALGHTTSAGGLGAVALGYGVTTMGSGSTNNGYQSTITGSFSSNLGSFNGINASKATSIGLGLLNDQEGCTIVGRFNAPTGTYDYEDDTMNALKKIFIVGGGKDADARKNILETTADYKTKVANNMYYDPLVRNSMTFSQTTLIDKKYFDDNIPSGGGGGSAQLQDYSFSSMIEGYYSGEYITISTIIDHNDFAGLKFGHMYNSDSVGKINVDTMFGQLVVFDSTLEDSYKKVLIKGNIVISQEEVDGNNLVENPNVYILANNGNIVIGAASGTGIRNLALSARNSTVNTFMVAKIGVVLYDDKSGQYYLFFNPQIL